MPHKSRKDISKMAKIIVRRGDAIVEFEKEQDWTKQDGDVRLFTQEDYNALDARLQSKYEAKGSEWKTKFETANTELETLKQTITTEKETKLNGLKTKIADAKKNLSPKDLKTLEILEKNSIEDAYTWLTDETIVKEGKKKSPITPHGEGEGDGTVKQKPIGTII